MRQVKFTCRLCSQLKYSSQNTQRELSNGQQCPGVCEMSSSCFYYYT